MEDIKRLTSIVPRESDEKDLEEDYKFARSRYYDLSLKGSEMIRVLMELARDSEHPRIFEVLSNMMKQNAEIADRLLETQKLHKAIKGASSGPQSGAPQNVTQNNVYVGSTTDLQRMLQEKMKKAKGIKESRVITQDED